MTHSVAIVTGAGGDIGRAIVKVLRRQYAVVVAADIDASAAKKVVAAFGQDGGIVAMQCDVTDAASIAEMVDVAHRSGTISALINNAGGVTAPSLHTTTLDNWRDDVRLNLEAAFLCFQAVVDDLKSSAGCVVNIASANAMGTYGHPGYSAAKAGLLSLTRSIAVEYGKFGLRANAIAPGSVRTRAWESRAAANPSLFEDVRRWYPLERIALAEDVANAAGFLCSPQASAVTGICLPVDCGLSAGQTALAHSFSQSEDY